MDSTEREETTQYAIKTINSCLERGEYTSALLLSFIYANIRLRTLLTEYLLPDKGKWKQAHAILGRLNFSGLLKECSNAKIVIKKDIKKFDELRTSRNKIAHESTLWKELTTNDIESIQESCEFVKTFLKSTT